ncbi:MAG: hypothetical protein DSZ00_05430 [Gammaproteobacteria bacterium]|nr:MAG: hypothetical protein DSZ00_05430 [Gammaproteobacteria bacterium]RTZ75512.1 MAG: hypothetical protein DSZ02_03270 [Gammaproteobacteria bacterium]
MDAAFGCSLGIPFGAFGTSGIPCRLAATGDYPPSLRSPWRAADAMCGDPTLFKRADSIEAGWELVQPLLDVWKALPPRDFPNYEAGSWGPAEADELMEKDGRQWRNRPLSSQK